MNASSQQLYWFGFPAFRGQKAPMQAYAAKHQAPIQLQVTMPTRKWTAGPAPFHVRHFVAVNDPHKLMQVLQEKVSPRRNHTFEIIQKRKPCKICMDFDQASGFPRELFADRADFTSKVQGALGQILEAEFGIQLQQEDFVWVFTEYTNKPKFSAHLVLHKVMPDGRLLCIPHHEKGETHDGSRYFYSRMVELMPELAGGLLDDKIYSSDREFRLPGACKAPNGNPDMGPLDEFDHWQPGTAQIATGHSLAEAMVGFLGGLEPYLLNLPTVDRCSQVGAKRCDGSGSKRISRGPPAGLTLSDAEARMLELISAQHPTAFKLRLAGRDIFDRDNAPRFNHSDRTEPCWGGGKPHKTNNYSAWFSGNDAWVHCFACNKNYKVGCLLDNFAAAEDIVVKCRWLSRQQNATEPDLQLLNLHLDHLISAATKVLCIQSVMGSGKTTLLQSLIEELADAHEARRVLIVTYRQSLSLSMLSDLSKLGFINYLQAQDQDIDLTGQERVIVQLDSIAKVCKGGRLVSRFDLVVLDETESTLHHCTAKTHKERQGHTFKTFCSITRAASRVLCLDAFLGAETRAFLRSLELPYTFVRNTWRSEEPRVFQLTNCEATWVAAIEKALQEGEHVALPCMSSTFMGRLQKDLVEKGILQEHEILLYDSETSDLVKRRVQFVNQDWVNYRLVMWSPAVEAGVNFDVKGHFHKMFLYMCSGANTALGVMQMTGRVRHLGCNNVFTMCSHLNLTGRDGPHWTPADAAEFFRWADDLSAQLPEEMQVQLNLREEQLETGDIALMPAHDTALLVAAHNYSRLMNSRCRLMHEWMELVEHAGHKCEVSESWAWGKSNSSADLPEHSRNLVVLGAPIIDWEQANDYLVLQIKGQASREQKEALARYFYCKAWGIENAALDMSFLTHHPAHDQEATTLKVLYQSLAVPMQPKGGPRFCENVTALAQPVEHKGIIIGELLQAMGICNVLDSTCNTCTLSPEIQDKLKLCRAFRSADSIRQTEHLFGLDNSTCGFKSAGLVAHRLKVLFTAAGLGVNVNRGHRKQVNKVKYVPYTLDFNTERTQTTAELFKVRYLPMAGADVSGNPQLTAFLTNLPIRLAAKYLNPKLTEHLTNLASKVGAPLCGTDLDEDL